MAFAKVSDYTNEDDNIEKLQLTLDKAFKGKMSLSLTNMATSTIPAIAIGSWMENNGALYESTTETAISTTDPVTSTTVADGDVYILLEPDTGTLDPAFTATAPTWSDSKQGWYGTGAQAGYRYVGYCDKSGTSYTDKKVIIGGPNDLDGELFDPSMV